MKKLSLKLILPLLLLNFCAVKMQAQNTENDEIKVIQAIWGMEKKAIVTEYMKFTDAEAAVFWPIYEQYQTEYQTLGKERITLISEYVNNLSSLTNEKVDEIMQGVLKNNVSVDKLQTKYYKKIKKEISPIRAAQFMQLEYYLQTMIRAEIQNNIPFIGELNKKAK